MASVADTALNHSLTHSLTHPPTVSVSLKHTYIHTHLQHPPPTHTHTHARTPNTHTHTLCLKFIAYMNTHILLHRHHIIFSRVINVYKDDEQRQSMWVYTCMYTECLYKDQRRGGSAGSTHALRLILFDRPSVVNYILH